MHIPLLILAATAFGADSIDSILQDQWNAQSITPAEICSDDEFLRRISLDLIGRIPTRKELLAFRTTPDRSAKIDELLDSKAFARSWSEVWTATLNGYSNAFESDREVLRVWLERAFDNKWSYDRIAAELINARGTSALDGPVNFLVRHPEDPAITVCRLFLGVRLDCARCHDHPFDRWQREDFERMNRFFEAVRVEEVGEGNIRISNRRVDADDDDRPRFLTGARPRTSQWRLELALFVTNSKPFSRAFANRLWYYLLGRGIVHPVDDFNQQNPAASPRLLAFLAEQARASKFDLRHMIRLICNSRAYQLSSLYEMRGGKAESLFAFRKLKPLTPEQAYDSVASALNLKTDELQRREFIERAVGEMLDEDFSNTWEYRETVQVLMTRLTTTLPVPTAKVTELYERILTREPTSLEKKVCRGKAPRDLVFALVNSNEFFFNH